MGRANGQAGAVTATTGFQAAFGTRRGIGDARLDRAELSQAAQARLDQALHLARNGNFTEVASLLHKHRKTLNSPHVAKLLNDAVLIACERENDTREAWLSDLIHSTLRDGRDGRILRQSIQMGSRHQPGIMLVHLAPDAHIDDIPFRTKRPALCGADEQLQRAPVGAWDNSTGEGRCEYRRCTTCAQHAALVPETARTGAALLPEEDLALLRGALHSEVEQGVRKALAGSRPLRGERFGDLAAKHYVGAAVKAAASYAISGGDERLDLYCSFLSINVADQASRNHYDGPLIELLDADWFEKALRARVPKREPAPPAFSSRQQRTLREAQSKRRQRFNEAVHNELYRRASDYGGTGPTRGPAARRRAT